MGRGGTARGGGARRVRRLLCELAALLVEEMLQLAAWRVLEEEVERVVVLEGAVQPEHVRVREREHRLLLSEDVRLLLLRLHLVSVDHLEREPLTRVGAPAEGDEHHDGERATAELAHLLQLRHAPHL